METTPDTLTHVSEELQAAWLQGRLTDSRKLLVDLHLSQCAACRQRLSDVDATHQASASGEPRADARAAPATGEELARGTAVGRFVVLEQIGSGGMGVVYAGYDPLLERKVALKLLRLENIPDRHLGEARGRLLREAQAIARLAHPNVVTVFDAGEWSGAIFVAMEFVDGGTLQEWSRAERREWRVTLDKYLGAAAGLAAAHSAGVVHRDFKPANVLLGRDGRPRVADFGLARASTDRALEQVPLSASSPTSSSIDPDELKTAVGSLVGTPAFMSPEQMLGQVADARSDQFSFCVSLYEALYGTRPFPAADLNAVLRRIREADLEPPRRAAGPKGLRRVLARGLAAEPEDRYRSMDALLDALHRVRRAGARRRSVLLAGLVALAVPAAAVFGARSGAEVCAGSEDLLATAWSAPRRQAILQGWTQTSAGTRHTGAMQPALALLDRYAGAWAGARTSACEAARVRREETLEVFSLRMACFERRRRELEAAARALEGARVEQAPHLVDVATSLSPIAACDAPEVLARMGVKAPPPAHAAQVEAVRAQLAEARSLGMLQDERALPLARQALAAAEQVAYPPLKAEAHNALGQQLTTDREFEAAHQSLHRAVLEAETTGHDEVRLGAEAGLARLLGFRQSRFAQGHVHVDRALAVMERLGGAPQDEADLLNLKGTILFQETRYDEAEADFRRALALERQLHGEEHPRVGRVLGNLGQTLKQRGQLKDAEEVARRAVELLLRTAGPGYRSTAIARHSLGTILLRGGRGAEAIGLMLEDHPDFHEERVSRTDVNLHVRLALAHLQAGAPEKAGRALDSVERFLDAEGFADDSMERLDAQNARVHYLASVGRRAEAVRLGRARLDRLRGGELARSLTMVEGLVYVGWLELREGAVAAAEETLRQARVLADGLPRGVVILGELGSLEGELYLARGDPAMARLALERTLRRQEQTELDEWRLAKTQFALVRALHALGEAAARDEVVRQLEASLASPQTQVRLMSREYRDWRAAQRLR